MCRLVFSQSLLSLDLIEAFLQYKNEEAEKVNETKKKKCDKVSTWIKDEDFLRMDGSTGAIKRNSFTEQFNDAANKRCLEQDFYIYAQVPGSPV